MGEPAGRGEATGHDPPLVAEVSEEPARPTEFFSSLPGPDLTALSTPCAIVPRGIHPALGNRTLGDVSLAIRLTTTVSGNILEVRASGFDENLEDTQAYGLGVIAAGSRAGVRRILCDERDLEYRLGTLDTYDLAAFIAAQVPDVDRTAIVCNPRFLADARFWEDTAVNRGLSVRVFTDPDAARRWLAEEDAGHGTPA
jgi:hypothetical protein